jgi:probable phosphoglycerate mutase
VRHGETEGQSSIRFHGHNDVPLSAAGRAQIRALAPLLQGLQPAAVVHSPLSRAAESAALLCEACGFPAQRLCADLRLREISFGHCEGMTADEIAAAHPEFWQLHQRGEADAFPGGESRAAFALRVAAAVAQHAAGGDEDLLVVAHRGTVRHALATLLGEAGAASFGVRLGSLTVVRRDEDWRLELFDFVP